MSKRRNRPVGSFRVVAYDEALARQREKLLAMVPEHRRYRVLGRRMDAFETAELAALTIKIQGYMATHLGRLTSSDAPPVD